MAHMFLGSDYVQKVIWECRPHTLLVQAWGCMTFYKNPVSGLYLINERCFIKSKNQ